MTVKRRSHGRNKKGRGHVNRVRCASTGKAIPKDKAIKRFIVRNIVDASSMRDIRDASAYETYALPKIYIKQYYCIEAAVHQRIVRSGRDGPPQPRPAAALPAPLGGVRGSGAPRGDGAARRAAPLAARRAGTT
ncbi:hypothetical protein JL720_712 [Aureococcus anophagefferens]|nr:hypothetical protein JL720_712 [Aureococcus anophagefferens]